MEQKKLWDELSKGVIGNLYLLYGEEQFLVRHYAGGIEKAALSQDPGILKDVFEEESPVVDIISAGKTLPFLASKKLIYVKDSMLFTSGRKDDSESLADFFKDIPEETVMVFIEKDVDRRLRVYKKIQEHGRVVECGNQSTQDLVKWIIRVMKENGKVISRPDAGLLLSTCGGDMTNLYTEIAKLAAYAGERGSVVPEDIREAATSTLEARIFSLTKAMGDGKVSLALKEYATMLTLKESPFVILAMIIRQLRIILMVKKGTEKRLSRQQIATDAGIREFVVSEALSQAARFTEEELISSLRLCMDTDIKLKTGLLQPEIGVEMLLISVAS